jgi:hypothetical protein
MNATALLFLNEFDGYVCAVMKQFLTAKDDPMFLVIKHVQVNVGVKLDFQTIFSNFYPKIYAIASIAYSFTLIYNAYYEYGDAILVPPFLKSFLS